MHETLVHPDHGYWMPEALDPDTDGEWVMVDDDAPIDYAAAAVQRWRDEKPTLEPGAMPYVRRLTEADIEAMRG